MNRCWCTVLLLPILACAAPPPEDGRLVDFDRLDAGRLSAQDCQAQIGSIPGGKALEFTGHLGPNWPSATITGDWDLTGYDYVDADITNLSASPVRVLISVTNAGGNQDRGDSTGSGTIEGGSSGTVRITLGEWHGTPKPIDLAKITMLRVLLDRPKTASHFYVTRLRAVKFDRSAMNAVFATPYYQSLTNLLGRGINMGNMLEAPKEGEWGVRLDESYFKTIADAGFQNVRIPCKWSVRTTTEPPYTVDPAFLARVDRALDAALGAGLKVVLNIHHYDEIMKDPAGQRDRFLAIWRQLAEHFKDRPDGLLFELCNEPMGQLTAKPWNDLVQAVIPIIRETNRERWIVVGPPNWNSVDALSQLDLPAADRRIMVTFHFYNPFQFTHQGAGWVGEQSKQWLGTKWTGSQAEQRPIIRQFDQAVAWAVEHERPLYVGEFGAYSTADMESRATWTRFIAEQALERKMGFAYWEFASGFGAWDPQTQAWRNPLLQALTSAAP